MKKAHYSFAVIILNYNVASDAIAAARSVVDTTLRDDYIICIADNGSERDVNLLQNLCLENTKVFLWEENLGYAKGNNRAIRMLEQECEFDYVIIMNPDVLLEEINVIDKLIVSIEKEDDTVVGIQPLIHHLDREGDACYQHQVRKLHTFIDEFLVQSCLMKKIFKKRMGKLRYTSFIPYKNKIYFEVPSGCFFLMKTEAFQKVGYFDERTFLYQEEFILAHKIKENGGTFVLVPDVTVEHYHGKSTGNRNKGMTKKGHTALVDSVALYLKEYVKVPVVFITLLKIMMKLEYWIKCKLRYYV